jgi:festuclavine dehydrogenase
MICLRLSLLENFIQLFGRSIRQRSEIVTATGDGKVGFISADDIADIAVQSLTDEQSHNREYAIMGPELLTYSEVAAKLSEIVGRTIEHTSISPSDAEGFATIVEDRRYPGLEFGKFLIGTAEGGIGEGFEERMYGTDIVLKGKRYISDYFETNKAVWERD